MIKYILLLLLPVCVKAQNVNMELIEPTSAMNLLNKLAPPTGVQADALGFIHPKITYVQNPHYIDNAGQFPRFYKGNDTFVVRTSLFNGGIDFSQDSGLSFAKPLVIINGVDQVTINGGIRGANWQYVKLLGWGSDSAYGFKIVGGGTGGNFDGMQKGNVISGVRFTGGNFGGVWWKSDPNNICQFPNEYNQYGPGMPNADPGKYIYADPYQYFQKNYDSLYFVHNKVDNCGGEAIYFGSTDYIMQNGQWERPVPCLNNLRPVPAQLGNCHADSNDVNTCGRTGCQMSQATYGINSIRGNHFQNIGFEWASTHDNQALAQGASVRVGWQWNQQPNRQMNVIGNYGDTSFLYFLDIEEAANVQSNNFGTHFGMVYYNGSIVSNPQPNPSGFFQAKNKASIIQQICNNNLLSTTGGEGVTFAVYNSTNYLATGNHGNGNNQAISYFGSGGLFDTQCGALTPPDTGCVPTRVPVMHDTLRVAHFDSTFKDSAARIFTMDSLIEKYNTKTYRYRKNEFGSYKDTVYKVLIRPKYDSVYYQKNGASHDSTECIYKVFTSTYGTFIQDGYNGLTTATQKINYTKTVVGVPAIRFQWIFGNTWTNQMYLDSGINGIPTINTDNVATGPHPFPNNPTYVYNTTLAAFTSSKPKKIAGFQNEPGTGQYWDTTGGGTLNGTKYINDYLNGFVPACNAAGIEPVDGGITTPVFYALADHYQSQGKTDSLDYLRLATGNAPSFSFTNTAQKIYWRDFFKTVLNGIKNSNVKYVQIHNYGDTTSIKYKLLTTIINYVCSTTGKKPVVFETGVDAAVNQTQFNSYFTEWKQANTEYILYYLGTGMSSTPKESFFINFKTNNP